MAETASNSNSQLPIWLVKLCKWLWKKQSFIWVTIILGIIINLFAAWLFTPWSTDYKNLRIWWVFQNSIIFLFTGLFLLLLTLITYMGSLFDIKITDSNQDRRSDEIIPNPNQDFDEATSNLDKTFNQNASYPKKDIESRYLRRMIRDNQTLTLKGIPAGLIDKGVQLDEVFIPLQFRPNRPITEYPLTQSELKQFRESLERDELPEELERILIAAEKSWYLSSKQSQIINIHQLWNNLNADHPVAVIQGFPGMGKSTFLARLALHMARCRLDQPDPTMLDKLEPSMMPLFLSLGRYASSIARSKEMNTSLSLSAYLELVLHQLNIPNLFPLIEEHIANGHCLILLDGLDEVSDPHMRQEVQEAIRTFILEHSDNSEDIKNFNRFLITSRVAGYDQNAFPNYIHYTIAELTPQQIKEFLPRWCRANVRRDHYSTPDDQGEQENAIAREAEFMENKLSSAILHHRGVRELVENPLLLTLLAVMQQNSIELPRERVELYSIITRTLLENRNIAKGLPIVPETQAIQRLGPIAFHMQETENSFARKSEVLNSLKQTIQNEEGGTADQIEEEAKNFLDRIRERAGLFVLRSGDYFGFFHRTFQEYFAARYLLNQIKNNTDHGILELVNRARRSDDLWREPFLLAIAYQSSDNEKIAQQIIRNLLSWPQGTSIISQAHDLLLAADSIIEAKPSTMSSTLENQVIERLLEAYAQAQSARIFIICERIENVLLRWLLSLPEETYRPSLLIVLHKFIIDSHHPSLQIATLTLLITIVNKIATSSRIIFDTLIPPLLALAGLPSIDKYVPTTLITEPDIIVSDLALTVLTYMGRRGPSGLFLAHVRQHFVDHPEQLRLLAYYSLDSKKLITCVNIPLASENYQSYVKAILQWKILHDNFERDFITDSDLEICINIHKSLLDCAEEVCYPSAIYLLNMLKQSESHPDQPWQQIWQQYLLQQMISGNYVDFQEISLLWITLFWQQLDPLINMLWATLFPGWQNLITLYPLGSTQFNNANKLVHRFAQHFLATISSDLLYIEKNPRGIINIRDLNHIMCLRYLRNIKFLQYLVQIASLERIDKHGSAISDTSSMYSLQKRIYLANLSKDGEAQHLIDILDLRDFNTFRTLILTTEITEDIIKHIPSNEIEEYNDLLTILLGRILKIQWNGEIGNSIEYELQKIVRTVRIGLPSTNEKIHELTLNILRSLPARTENEITFILRLADETTDIRVQWAYADALEHALPRPSAQSKFRKAISLTHVEMVQNVIMKHFTQVQPHKDNKG